LIDKVARCAKCCEFSSAVAGSNFQRDSPARLLGLLSGRDWKSPDKTLVPESPRPGTPST
jgi:hypothetical protein